MQNGSTLQPVSGQTAQTSPPAARNVLREGRLRRNHSAASSSPSVHDSGPRPGPAGPAGPATRHEQPPPPVASTRAFGSEPMPCEAGVLGVIVLEVHWPLLQVCWPGQCTPKHGSRSQSPVVSEQLRPSPQVIPAHVSSTHLPVAGSQPLPLLHETV